MAADFHVAIRDLLAAQGFTDATGLSPSWLLGVEKEDPDFVAVVLPESGAAPQRTVGEFPSFSVRVRHLNAAEANALLRRVFQFLQEFQGQPSGVPVARVIASAGPVQLGRDRDGGQGRWRVQQTFNAVVQQYDQFS